MGLSMGIRDFAGGLNRGLQQLSPEQRAMLLRTAAGTTRNPQMARGLMSQAQEMIAIEENKKKMAMQKQLEEVKQQQWQRGYELQKQSTAANIANQQAIREQQAQRINLEASRFAQNKEAYEQGRADDALYAEEMKTWLGLDRTNQEQVANFIGSIKSPKMVDYLSQRGQYRPTDRDKRIGDYTSLGYDYATSVGMADGFVEKTKDPIDGTITITNYLTGKTHTFGSEKEAANAAQQGTSLWDMAQLVTGPGPYAKRGINASLGPVVPEGYLYLDTAEAQKNFKAQNEEMIRAFLKNTRAPVSEQDQIRKELTFSPGIWKDPAVLQSEMVGVWKNLEDRKNANREMANNRNIDVKERREALAQIQVIDNLQRRLGVPPEALMEAQGGVLVEDAQGNRAYRMPDGSYQEVPQ